MSDPVQERPQIYLLTPPAFDLDTFPARLAAVLDTHAVACVRLALASKDEDVLGRAADACREVCHARDVAIVIEAHVALAERHGLDGVHLTDGSRSVRKVRKLLGDEAIVGAFCGASRHDGLNAGESGADYIAFGPVGDTDLGDGTQAEKDTFQWWSEVVEVPVVAEGALTVEIVKEFAKITDFFAIGEEIWNTEDPIKSLGAFIAAMDDGLSA
ncbi:MULTISPECIES: thiamine phosphate synthase [Roseobacteraceae]|jgi:thiamine-phosphate pyrophosphorylase|uniref:Thiamine monophosphate synthase n=1 Tax=Celeribacter baekdonensis B30 TaxID=1208323 RepID=K2JNA3_9RHOB|nr:MULTISPECIES: thiamine phosphate synthase [Roseobacteraceae]EKE71984.1 thiamine monophosphate synthase [Celeribacter baekdonensis B30]KAB6715054.1 thiamine phosphate synthase [Roseobacter sp. TSBP12]|tara:strand:- start:4248 stop:4889 length:642 start_codon:yes stop_codon:yes gene_type:complete